ncbi:hypothetical protein B296_00019213 [Ensete ventricosum]|uniref:Uncharacterized protein n=1 Tax=Ensete ventricosum TaxID=4639 RepID=A0A426Z0P8_ENSVE|nr:hypothetical protein B296_00019213 [Ensete ventricosum]
MSSDVRAAEATIGAWRKRKDRDQSDFPPAESSAGSDLARPAPACDNRLLAGCLAHEFLTRGTLFEKRWEANGSEPENKFACPILSSADAEPPSSYAGVSYLLKAEGARIPGVVNPSQLARWLRM